MFGHLHPFEAIYDYLNAGGPVVVALMGSTFVLWALILERILYFSTTQRRMAREKRARWDNRADHSSWYAHAIREQLISELRMSNQRFLDVIRVLILTTPLLGLLGTVTGMIEVFQIITSSGSSNARLMASGISKATIPTMTGLAVSLSGVLLINLLDRQVLRTLAHFEDNLEIHVDTSRTKKGRTHET